MNNYNKKFPKVGLGVLIENDKGEFLFGLRKEPGGVSRWWIPGGHLELGETIFQCAKREILEETGLEIRDLNLVSVGDELGYIDKTGDHYLNIGVKATSSGEPRLLEPEKFLEWKWFPEGSFPEDIYEGSRLIYQNFKSGQVYRE